MTMDYGRRRPTIHGNDLNKQKFILKRHWPRDWPTKRNTMAGQVPIVLGANGFLVASQSTISP